VLQLLPARPCAASALCSSHMPTRAAAQLAAQAIFMQIDKQPAALMTYCDTSSKAVKSSSHAPSRGAAQPASETFHTKHRTHPYLKQQRRCAASPSSQAMCGQRLMQQPHANQGSSTDGCASHQQADSQTACSTDDIPEYPCSSHAPSRTAAQAVSETFHTKHRTRPYLK
jgi:hypothetical protein